MERMNRYRKTVFCVVEGQQEELYLKHLEALISDFPSRTIRFNIVVGNADRLDRNDIEYDSVCLFDHDMKEPAFARNLDKCNELNRKWGRKSKKDRRKVFHAYSNVCFDLWLLLHKKDFRKPTNTPDGYIKELKKAYGLPIESDVKSRETILAMLNQITLDDVYSAISRANSIKASKLSSDTKRTPKGAEFYDNPDMSIQTFLMELLSEIFG